MPRKIIFKITDYFEPDLKWEEQQCKKLGIEFYYYQMRDALPEELIVTFKDADIILTDMATFNAEVMDGLEKVKILLRHGVGYDKIDVDAATRNGIVIANEATASSEDVAEHTLMLILETSRKRKLQDEALERWIETREWSSEGISPIYRMKDKTLGIIGCGNIGARVLKKVSGLGMKVLVCDPYLTQARYEELGITHVPLDDVLTAADIVTIHVPLTGETRHLFNLKKFKLMKKSAFVINTARGSIVKTEDLITALKKGIIAGAGIDVYEQEPPPADLELLKMDNVILTPHFAWYSEESGWDIRYLIIDDLKRFLREELPKYIINPEVLEKPNLRFQFRE